MPNEAWRPASGFPKYEVSSLGRVRRAVRGNATQPGRILVGKVSRNGYRQLSLSNNGRRPDSILAHRLVAAAFIGPRPPGKQINHKNGDKLDNRAENLEYCTLSENLLHRHRVLGVKGQRGEKSSSAKLTTAQVIEIRRTAGSITNGEWGGRLGVSPSLISMIRTGRIWPDAGGPTGYRWTKRARGERTGAAKLTEADVRFIRANRGTMTQKALAAHFGVANSLISHVQSGRGWSHVT